MSQRTDQTIEAGAEVVARAKMGKMASCLGTILVVSPLLGGQILSGGCGWPPSGLSMVTWKSKPECPEGHLSSGDQDGQFPCEEVRKAKPRLMIFLATNQTLLRLERYCAIMIHQAHS